MLNQWIRCAVSTSTSEVEQALDVLLQERTAIVIAHRLSTAMKCDRIVVIEEGRISESGSPDELLRAGGRFAQMFEAWTLHAEDSSVS